MFWPVFVAFSSIKMTSGGTPRGDRMVAVMSSLPSGELADCSSASCSRKDHGGEHALEVKIRGVCRYAEVVAPQSYPDVD